MRYNICTVFKQLHFFLIAHHTCAVWKLSLQTRYFSPLLQLFFGVYNIPEGSERIVSVRPFQSFLLANPPLRLLVTTATFEWVFRVCVNVNRGTAERVDGLCSLGFSLWVMETVQVRLAVCCSVCAAGGERQNRRVFICKRCQISHGKPDSALHLTPCCISLLCVSSMLLCYYDPLRLAGCCSGGLSVRRCRFPGQRSDWEDLQEGSLTWLHHRRFNSMQSVSLKCDIMAVCSLFYSSFSFLHIWQNVMGRCKKTTSTGLEQRTLKCIPYSIKKGRKKY